MRRTLVLYLFTSLLLQAPGGHTRGQAKQTNTPVSAPLPLDHGGKIASKYDGFRRETVVTLKPKDGFDVLNLGGF